MAGASSERAEPRGIARGCQHAITMFRGGRTARIRCASEPEAAIVRSIFERFVRIGSATVLARELRAEGIRTKRGKLFDKG
ncbi:MAG: recombinase family protein [Thermoanaerobaculia bacterium]|nr:recombinase family protein [Thermoanaerobaculia bacterium]